MVRAAPRSTRTERSWACPRRRSTPTPPGPATCSPPPMSPVGRQGCRRWTRPGGQRLSSPRCSGNAELAARDDLRAAADEDALDPLRRALDARVERRRAAELDALRDLDLVAAPDPP